MDYNPLHKLSADAIREFKEIYRQEFGDDLTDDEAEAIAVRVIRFFHILVYGKNLDTDR